MLSDQMVFFSLANRTIHIVSNFFKVLGIEISLDSFQSEAGSKNEIMKAVTL